MSRHRDIRNLNIQDELQDDALSDGGDYEITPEQEAQLNDGLEQVRSIIGDADISGLSDASIKEVLWEYYCNVEKTVQWALEQQEKRRIAQERKESWEGQELDDQQYQYHGHHNYGADYTIQEYHDTDNGPRLPSIFLAQQQPGFDNEAYLAVESPRPLKTFLSTISEHTERTDPSTPYHSRQHRLLPASSRSFVSSPTTSYGNELDDGMSGHWQDPYNDPNTSRHSPSQSAIAHLSKFEPPPSNDSTSTITPNDIYLHPTSEPRSSLDNIPTIPDLESKASEPIITQKSLPATPISTRPQSKLSSLASSKASSVASVSSRSSGTSVTGSIKTFPNLRPSAQSERPGSPISVASSKSLPPIPPPSDGPDHTRQTTATSATSSLVRKAIETALQLEDLDRVNLMTPKRGLHRPMPLAVEDDRSTTPTPSNIGVHPVSQSTEPKAPSTLPMSKLALLAQQRAGSTTASTSSLRSPVNLPSPTSSNASRDSRPPSKLAILAQQKVDASKKPKLPKPTTEYLTPIANGTSVTTAITTSYQSLYSLTDPSKPNFIPKLNVVPLQAVAAGSSPDQRQSKLAMKVQRAGKKAVSPGFPSEEEIVTPPPPLSPLFLPNSSARGSPSAFASVLISDPDSAQDNGKKDAKRKGKGHRRKREAEKVESPSDSHPQRSRKHKHSSKPTSAEAITDRPPPFAFDGPSPDDIVLNARKGTSVGQKLTPTPSIRLSAGTGK